MSFWLQTGKKGLTDTSYGWVWKSSGFLVYLNFKDSEFTAVKKDGTFWAKYVKGVQFANRGYMKGVPFLSKMVYKKVRGWTLGQSLPV